ncbi:MAG: DNA polymerase IV [Bacteroidales bacterium]|jgi:DNA polymerase-4|nr:DNA polymerase IV [Bacteroidales bacterium]NLM92000.1 DNA polymerase IV [Bacteroidales bacterium]
MDTTSRTIAHLDQDTFFVSVERLHNSSLIGKPVIIGGMGDRGVVASCSYEARQFGVHSAMPMKLARNLCNDAVFIRGDLDSYSKYSNIITQIIAERAPVFEKASIDEHYLDITGMDRFFGCYKWASELRHTIIKETGLPISMGLSMNKTVSKIATGEAKPNGQIRVEQPLLHSFLDPLSIRKIPMIGSKTYYTLRTMGIATIGTLSRIPPEVMENMLGKNGKLIWQRANGIDNSPVQSWSERKSIGTETTFETDTIDIARINDLLVRMCEQQAFRLRKKQQLTGCVTVKIRYANFDTHTLQQSLPYTAFDHILIPVCKELFRRLYTRRMLIRLVGVQFTRLVHGVQQLNMFEETPELISLYQAIDRMRRKHGEEAIHRGVAMTPG